MKKLIALLPILALSSGAQADTAFGALSNFDTVNDTGSDCYGFEIEIDDAHSRDIGGTFTYNHYGTPTIHEDTFLDPDLTKPAHPRVFIRYEVAKPSGLDTGTTAGITKAAVGPITPTGGHQCTNPGVNNGCEHFGVGIYTNTFTAVKYNWLVKSADGKTNVPGPVVHVGAPSWYYQAPGVQPAVVKPNPAPNLPPVQVLPPQQNIAAPAQVVAVMPAPPAPVPPSKLFGEPSWVKVIKTSTHKANPLVLDDLVGDDDVNGVPLWRNGIVQVPADVESEFYLLQTQLPDPKAAVAGNLKNVAKAEKAGNSDGMGDGSEVVTRRYEFYAYSGPAATIDGENGEAMCDNVDTSIVGNYGIAGSVDVTQIDPADATQTITTTIDCSQYQIVGAYRGAQMGEFNAAPPLALIDKIQDINIYDGFPERRLPNGGKPTYTTTITGSLPNGLALESATGILSGTPAKVGKYSFTASVNDLANHPVPVSQTYTVNVTGPADVDGNFSIDTADLASIKAKYGQSALARDPADVNGDHIINLVDYRKASLLCSKSRCAP